MTTEADDHLAEVWGGRVRAFACSECQHAMLAPAAARQDAGCPWCGARALSHHPALQHSAAPEQVISFAVSRPEALRVLKAGLKKVPRWVRPSDLTEDRLGSRLRRAYFPMWLVDSDVEATWSGQMGFNYDVKTHREELVEGQWKSRALKRTHIDWEPRAGTFQRRIDNVSAPALMEHARLVRSLGDFNPAGAEAFEPAQLQDAVTLLPNLSQAEAWREAQEGFVEEVSALLMKASEAQHLEKLMLEEEHAEQHWTLRLLPLWTTWYRTDEGRLELVRIQGQRVQAAGRLVPSAKKATRMLLALWAIAAILLLVAVYAPRLDGFLSFVLGAVGVGLGVAAPIVTSKARKETRWGR